MAVRRSGFRVALWWALNRERVFLLRGLAVAAGLAVLLVAVLGRAGGGETVVGRVVGFGLQETDMGSYPVAVVQLRDTRTSVVLDRSHNCRVGDAIKLRRRSLGLVSFYLEPCTRGGAPS